MSIALNAAMDAASDVAITLDIDWAPDFVIDDVAARLVAAGVRATWFVTHASPAVSRLRLHPALFELGIHPNFLPGSTQGATPRAILEYCMSIVPDARSMRTHSLVQSTPLLIDVVSSTPVRTDVSLYLPQHGGLRPSPLPLPGGTLLRLPFCWEDDYEMYQSSPDWDVAGRMRSARGLRIMNFHPIHIALNSSSLAAYQQLKVTAPRLQDADRDAVHTVACHAAPGTGAAFDAVLAWLASQGGGSTVSQLAARWQPHSSLALAGLAA